MKLLLIGSMLFTGGGAVAMQNETVSTVVNENAKQAITTVQNRLGRRLAENVTETGFPYPPQQFMDTLTEDQVFAITSEIDQINAEYDWQNMTEDEIRVALEDIHTRLDTLYTDLGLELPAIQNQHRGMNRQQGRHGQFNDERSYDGQCPYDEVEEDTSPTDTDADTV
ncbi:MAG: hypothetical protein K9L26_02295 [Candidatus Izimaplasma sp.]|nr:hypothetical protein [Candidatus Izimaplasma bacterium]